MKGSSGRFDGGGAVVRVSVKRCLRVPACPLNWRALQTCAAAEKEEEQKKKVKEKVCLPTTSKHSTRISSNELHRFVRRQSQTNSNLHNLCIPFLSLSAAESEQKQCVLCCVSISADEEDRVLDDPAQTFADCRVKYCVCLAGWLVGLQEMHTQKTTTQLHN